MAKKIPSLLIVLLITICAHAETIILRTGARVKGEIVFQNEEVVILRDAAGARFQYPRTDVSDILSDDAALSDVSDDANAQDATIPVSKKASILLELAGGAAVIPAHAAGGAFSADLLVGSHHIKDRHLFIGAGLGYHGMIVGEEKYNFLPIQLALRMPLTEQKHAPVFGAALGYGIALSADYKGGLYAGLDFGYRCQLNPKTALALVAFAHFQQARLTLPETIDDMSFDHTAECNLIATGLKFAFYF